nr:hypothetical protein [Tanacetum cinerariifolium]
MPPRMMTRSAGLPIVESRGGERVNGLVEVGGVEDLGDGNNERVDKSNGQENDQGERANRNVEGVNEGVGGALDFSMIIA